MNSSIRSLLDNGPVLTDGAWGTQLQERGLQFGDCPDAWNLTNPDRVAEVAAAYAEAGSRVILTNTFRANRIALEGYGLADRTSEINAAGVAISRRGAAGRASVFASIGPSGKMLAAEEVTEAALLEAFAEQASALAAAGADALVIETMSDLNEAILAIRAAKPTGLPVIACMVYDTGRSRDRTMMGTTPEQAAADLTAAGADVIGANCGCGIEGYLAISRRLHSATSLPIWIKANAGLPEVVDGKAIYRMQAAEFAAHCMTLRSEGASFIGGCCGTSPAFIRAVSERLTEAARCA
ncbi:MAG: homocysteine S-methyltransferase family protein [Bryobacteraceae bacterium]|nr:homocysteine S-methyltransferase family protein [Bryobacteraceae bacterium]